MSGHASILRHRMRWLASLRRGCLLVILAAVAAGIATPGARAASNGRIAYEIPPDSTPSLATINADKSGEQPIPHVPPDSANPAWSADGNRLAFTSTTSGRTQVYIINVDGSSLTQITSDPVAGTDPTWSPDGQELAFTSWSGGSPNIWVVDLGTHGFAQLTRGSGINQQPRWSPDGNLIAFASNRTGHFEIYTMRPDGTAQQAVTSRTGDNTDPAWSPQGDQLAYTNTVGTGRQIYAIGRTGGGDRRLTQNGDGSDQFPAWSPDGTQIAFTRDQGLWVMAAAGESGDSLAKEITALGVDPVWAPAPPLVAQPVGGSVTTTAPGAATTALTSATTVPSQTVVNATQGAVVVKFKPLAAPLNTPPSTALVQHAKVTLTDRTTHHVTLDFATPKCAKPHRGAFVASPIGPHASATIHGRAFRSKSHYVRVDVKDPVYSFEVSCHGTTVTVKSGAVTATVINTHLPITVTLTTGNGRRRIVLQRGHKPTVRVLAGASLFVPDRG